MVEASLSVFFLLKTQSKKVERVKAENQYFPYSTLIRRAMVEAYCPTLVELVNVKPYLLLIFSLPRD